MRLYAFIIGTFVSIALGPDTSNAQELDEIILSASLEPIRPGRGQIVLRQPFLDASDYKIGNLTARLSDKDDQTDCFTNPVIKMASNTDMSDAVEGNRRFKIKADEANEIVLYLRAPASRILRDEASDIFQDGIYDLVIDHITISSEAEITSKYGTGLVLYEIDAQSDHVTLKRKDIEHLPIFCADQNIELDFKTSQILRPISPPTFGVSYSYSFSEIDADPSIESYTLSVGTLSSISGIELKDWRTRFGETDQNRDQCTPEVGKPITLQFSTTLQCQSGGQIQISNPKIIRTPKSFSKSPERRFGLMFRRHSPDLLRFRLGTSPPDADIMVEGERQAKRTNTYMEFFQEDLDETNFHKTGFEPCPFKDWKILEVRKPRLQYEAECVLKPVERK